VHANACRPCDHASCPPVVHDQESDAEIFIVEPDARARASLVARLQRLGVPVHAHWCAETLLSTLTPEQGGCLITEADLPGLSGIELVRRLAHRGGRRIAVIICTENNVRTAVRALHEGAWSVLVKPLRGTELSRVTSDALQWSRGPSSPLI
jgi:two-component system CheB/CheR fusion protein